MYNLAYYCPTLIPKRISWYIPLDNNLLVYTIHDQNIGYYWNKWLVCQLQITTLWLVTEGGFPSYYLPKLPSLPHGGLLTYFSARRDQSIKAIPLNLSVAKPSNDRTKEYESSSSQPPGIYWSHVRWKYFPTLSKTHVAKGVTNDALLLCRCKCRHLIPVTKYKTFCGWLRCHYASGNWTLGDVI